MAVKKRQSGGEKGVEQTGKRYWLVLGCWCVSNVLIIVYWYIDLLVYWEVKYRWLLVFQYTNILNTPHLNLFFSTEIKHALGCWVVYLSWVLTQSDEATEMNYVMATARWTKLLVSSS